MFDFLNTNFDLISFLIGFAAGILCWLFISLAKKFSPKVKILTQSSVENVRQKYNAGVEAYLRQETLRTVQKLHISNSLFSLDEIIITPRLLAPPPNTRIADVPAPDFVADQLIPYTPDWPELASQYNVSTLSISEALEGGANIVIIGQPGSGKTVALAHLASLISRHSPEAGDLADSLPIFMHIFELDTSLSKNQDPLENLIAATAFKVSNVVRTRLKRAIRNSIKNHELILLLDGIDELPPDDLKSAANYLHILIDTYPGIRIITTASTEYLDGLVRIGMIPLGLASWNHSDIQKFFHRWNHAWSTDIIPKIKTRIKTGDLNFNIISSWLLSERRIINPLEWTLIIWAAFSVDLQGPNVLHALDAYITRVTKGVAPRSALELLAIEMCQNKNPFLEYKNVDRFFSRFRPSKTSVDQMDFLETEYSIGEDEKKQKKNRRKKERKVSSSERAITSLVEHGILKEYSNEKIGFVNPQIAGFLASFSPNFDETVLSPNFSWSLNSTTFQYSAAQNKATKLINEILESNFPPLYNNLLSVSRWISAAPGNYEWKTKIMKRLSGIFSFENIPLSSRAKILTAIISSNDQSILIFLNQLLASNNPEVRLLSYLGIGALGGKKQYNDLLDGINDPDQAVRKAACLALTVLDYSPAKQTVIDLFQNGDEGARQTTAEYLASVPGKGHELLKEALSSEDLILRRASVMSLALIKEDWVKSYLEKIAIEDGQWVVRNVAGQLLEFLNKSKNPKSPFPQSPPHESAWLVSFASKQGVGLSIDQPVTDMLLLALENGTQEEQLASLDYLKTIDDEGVINNLLKMVFQSQGIVREASFLALWTLAISGSDIADPLMYGYRN
ncbi:MAG: NACHT domain-containing protein [Anaerolineaceae bacterium]|nr:NACHT domain-containing protein [Anaerolineaceae bacterium]